jgi:hypothetical protein
MLAEDLVEQREPLGCHPLPAFPEEGQEAFPFRFDHVS